MTAVLRNLDTVVYEAKELMIKFSIYPITDLILFKYITDEPFINFIPAFSFIPLNFFHLYNEVELGVNPEDKELVNHILKKYVEERNNSIS